MSFIITLLLCICNYCYAAEQLTTSNELSDCYQEIAVDNLNDIVNSLQRDLTSSISTRPPKQSKSHQCSYCPIQVRGSISNFHQHNVLIHTICSCCSPEQQFSNRDELHDHLENEHDDWSWISKLKENLKRNKKMHFTDPSFFDQYICQDPSNSNNYLCKLCDYTFKYTFKSFEIHMATAHDQCIRCANVPLLNTSIGVISHYNEFHANLTNTKAIIKYLNSNKKPRSANNQRNSQLHICPITSCNKDIRGPKKNLLHHVAIVHYRCYQCGYAEVYTDKDTFIAHLSKHKDANRIISYLLNHEKQQSIESYTNDLDQTLSIDRKYRKEMACPVSSCRMKLKGTGGAFSIHMASKHNRCELCDHLPKFSTIQELYSHVISSHHTNGKTLITYLSKQKYIRAIKPDLDKKESFSNISDNHDHEEEHANNSYQELFAGSLDATDIPNDGIITNQSMGVLFDPLFDEIIDYN